MAATASFHTEQCCCLASTHEASPSVPDL